MEDVEVMKQLRAMITEWNVVDEQLIPGKFDILLRCSDMEQNLDVHCFSHCVEQAQASHVCLQREPTISNSDAGLPQACTIRMGEDRQRPARPCYVHKP